MQFESSFRRSVLCAALLAGVFTLAACDKATTNAPTVSSSPTPTTQVATPNNSPAQVAAPAATVALATPAPAAASAATGPTPIPLEGKDFDVTMLDAPKLKLSKMLGRKKIIVVNFWATWCGPCRKEIPELIALSKEYANKNVEIVGLSVEDPTQATTLVKNYKDQAQINYKLGFAPMPMFLAFNGARPGAPIPQTFIFGKDGKLLYHIPGMRPAFKDYVAQAIDTALKS